MTAWTVEIRPQARRQYRVLPADIKSEVRALIEDLEAIGPALIGAIEMRANPDTWRVRVYNGTFRMIYQVSRAKRRIAVTRISPRSLAYKGMKN